jgi:hypothetical protein
MADFSRVAFLDRHLGTDILEAGSDAFKARTTGALPAVITKP